MPRDFLSANPRYPATTEGHSWPFLLLGPQFMAGQPNHQQSNLPAPFTALRLSSASRRDDRH